MSQSLAHPLPHPVPELARCQHLDVRHPGENRLDLAGRRVQRQQVPVAVVPAITPHIPHKGAQMVRYYGWYSNKMRGVRHCGLV